MAKKAQLPKSPPPKGAGTAKKKSSSNSRMILLALIAGVVILAIGVILLQVNSARKPAVAAVATVGEGTGWGPADAPVKIVDFSDFG